MSFLAEKVVSEAFTFDDVLLVPAYSEVLPRDVNVSGRFSRNIVLNTPIVTAAMDTVTDSIMAIAIARLGGIGVIHKNMSIEQQAKEVRKVKRAENGMIIDPVTIEANYTVGQALQLMKEFKIGGIPVISEDRTLVGIVTNRDLRFEKNMTRPIREIMTCQNIITTNQFTDFAKAEEMLKTYKIEKLPVVDSDNKLIGLLTYKDITKAKDSPNSCKDSKGRLRVAAAIGVNNDSLDRIAALVDAGVDAVVIDTAHGHSRGVFEVVKAARKAFTNVDIVVGNIGTGAAARALVEIGADGVKVGIGPGSICTTRIIAGVGVPQLSAIYDIYSAIKNTGVPIIADGGVRYSGDIVKALAAGADCVMAGGLFAGVEESPGETIIFQGRKFKSYRGMGSVEAMQAGSKDRYFQDAEDDIAKLVPEGIVARVPYKGTLGEVVYQLIGGLRAGMGYCGAPNLNALKDARFVRITASGMAESHPHDVSITREAPNYSRD